MTTLNLELKLAETLTTFLKFLQEDELEQVKIIEKELEVHPAPLTIAAGLDAGDLVIKLEELKPAFADSFNLDAVIAFLTTEVTWSNLPKTLQTLKMVILAVLASLRALPAEDQRNYIYLYYAHMYDVKVRNIKTAIKELNEDLQKPLSTPLPFHVSAQVQRNKEVLSVINELGFMLLYTNNPFWNLRAISTDNYYVFLQNLGLLETAEDLVGSLTFTELYDSQDEVYDLSSPKLTQAEFYTTYLLDLPVSQYEDFMTGLLDEYESFINGITQFHEYVRDFFKSYMAVASAYKENPTRGMELRAPLFSQSPKHDIFPSIGSYYYVVGSVLVPLALGTTKEVKYEGVVRLTFEDQKISEVSTLNLVYTLADGTEVKIHEDLNILVTNDIMTNFEVEATKEEEADEDRK